MLSRLTLELASRFRSGQCGLQKMLVSEKKARWLDLGSKSLEDGFHCMDLGPLEESKSAHSARYFEKSVLELTADDFDAIGQFDFIRMQHVLEHFSFEEAESVLSACARLLNSGGYLLITVPDLRQHVKAYLNGYRTLPEREYRNFAMRWRIPADTPPSCAFSVFAHQGGYRDPLLAGDAHKWCYDFEGLKYQVDRVNSFENVRQLGVFHALAGIPFTHNRPAEDVCLLAQRR